MGEESIFEGDVGIWDADVIVRPAPGVPEQSSHGLAVQKLVGGKWLVLDFKNETTGFEGHGLLRWREATEHVDGDMRLYRQFWDFPAGEHELMMVTYRRRR